MAMLVHVMYIWESSSPLTYQVPNIPKKCIPLSSVINHTPLLYTIIVIKTSISSMLVWKQQLLPKLFETQIHVIKLAFIWEQYYVIVVRQRQWIEAWNWREQEDQCCGRCRSLFTDLSYWQSENCTQNFLVFLVFHFPSLTYLPFFML